jgi:hypothetical protein
MARNRKFRRAIESVKLAGGKSLGIRIEAFNVFNHAEFYGPASLDGEVNDPNFGTLVSAGRSSP